ncbi:MAG: alpha/beta hydrolase [Simkaniaceae bacterium]|nr:alpha/beta hydrolase [Simkaniaceae bacterium]
MYPVDVRAPVEVYCEGPPLEEGPKRAVFYFFISARDTLGLDPHNKPLEALKDTRVFSITLPYHEQGKNPLKAIDFWKGNLSEINTFITHCKDVIIELIEKNICTRIGVMGLSRGAVISLQLASQLIEISHIALFAPLIDLKDYGSEMDNFTLIDTLYDRKIKVFIGNRDTRVNTQLTCDFILKLSDRAYLEGVRSPPIELTLTPSIGRDGHGTPPESFLAGGRWLSENL